MNDLIPDTSSLEISKMSSIGNAEYHQAFILKTGANALGIFIDDHENSVVSFDSDIKWNSRGY